MAGSALARLVTPVAVTAAAPAQAVDLLDQMRKCVSQLGEVSRNYGHLSHERRQRSLTKLHTELRDIHEAMAAGQTAD